ncbi:aspartyl protease [Crocosphaera sp.]|uniref:aspartyl protease n=1 Tax=Crocosphaera sp. TaxID=2729996 RepID=UPI003F244BAF|nr:aspartyl protease [Crocosphaera sp.]
MIQGTFGNGDELLFTIELITGEGIALEVDAMLDTGFSDWLAIDEQDLEGLGWLYLNSELMLTARGYAEFDVYMGKVRIDGQEFDIPVHTGEGITDILMGRQWLKNGRLIVDMPSNILTLDVNSE